MVAVLSASFYPILRFNQFCSMYVCGTTWTSNLGLRGFVCVNHGGRHRNATDGSSIGPAPEAKVKVSAMGTVRGMLAV